MIERIGLKNEYHLKEVHIPVGSKEDTEAQLRGKVIPAILELEAKGLINGFYFLLHRQLDLRLSSASWVENEEKISSLLESKGLPGHLENYQDCRGNDFNNLENNSMEIGSRLSMACLMLADVDASGDRLKRVEELFMKCVHYMYNQFTYVNVEQAFIEFQSGFFQAKEGLRNKQCDKDYYVKMLAWVRNKAELEIQGTEATD